MSGEQEICEFMILLSLVSSGSLPSSIPNMAIWLPLGRVCLLLLSLSLLLLGSEVQLLSQGRAALHNAFE
jgi:hypothetical protein